MGRSKIWGFTALVVVGGLIGVWVFTLRAAPAAAEQVAATLQSGTLQFETGTRLLARQVHDVAAVAAQNPAIAAALGAAEAGRDAARSGARKPAAPAVALPDPEAAAAAAIRSAAALLEIEIGRAPLVGLAAGHGLSLRAGDKVFTARDPLAQSLLGASAAPRHVRIDGAIYAVAVVPAARGALLAFGLPIDPRWTERLKAATGADLTLLGATPASTLPPQDVAAVVEAARRGGGAVVDAGQLAPVSLGSGLPAVPVLLVQAPAYRARSLALPGIEGPAAVLAAPTARAFEPLGAFQQVALLGILVAGVVGLALGFTREETVAAHVPRELAGVADRISRGDFDVRVPRMSGTFGTLAAALARAAEAARLGRISQAAVPVAAVRPSPTPTPQFSAVLPVPAPAPTLDLPLTAVPPEETTGSRRLEDAFTAHGMAPPGTPTPQPLDPRAGASAVAAALAARASQPRTTQPLGLDGSPARAAGSARPEAPAPTPVPGRGATPAPTEGDEAQWRAVHEEFLRVRTGCGESVEGLTWERFRDKLRKNRDALAQKYACRTVRFQVYVKEGKAALKATPVR